jgi:hypothetical protein
MIFLLLHKLSGELKRGSDVLCGDGVFLLNFLKSHPAGQPADEPGYRNTRPPDHGFAVLNRRIDDNSLIHEITLMARPCMPVACQ